MTGLARARVVGALALTAVLASVPARAQVPLTGNDLAAVQQWMVGLEEYLMIREQAAGTVPLPRTSPDLPQVLEARTALASAIRDRRAGAKIGDLFTFEVRRTFRKLIARSIIAHEVVMSDLLAAVRRQIGPGSFRLTVNQPFPRQLAAVPSCVLDLLPPLPWELDFRIADHDLVLIDLGSGLVIDILSDALPRLVTGGWPEGRQPFLRDPLKTSKHETGAPKVHYQFSHENRFAHLTWWRDRVRRPEPRA